jgi:hypothetical protein
MPQIEGTDEPATRIFPPVSTASSIRLRRAPRATATPQSALPHGNTSSSQVFNRIGSRTDSTAAVDAGFRTPSEPRASVSLRTLFLQTTPNAYRSISASRHSTGQNRRHQAEITMESILGACFIRIYSQALTSYAAFCFLGSSDNVNYQGVCR